MNSNRTWLVRLVVAALVALIGVGGAIGLISLTVQVGNITIIIGDQNKVENGSQTQTVIQPTKPQEVEAKPQQPTPEPTPISTPPVQEESVAPATRPQASYARRGNPPIRYESEEDCTCPDDEVEEPQSPPEVRTIYVPQPRVVYVTQPRVVVVPSHSQYQSQTISSGEYSQSQVQTNSNGVYVQSNGVTVRTSTSGANTHTRVVINGRVVVDQ